MIEYEPGKFGVWFIFTCKGSVFPKALAWAIPSAAASLVLHHWVEHVPSMSISQVWSAYNFILGFLVVFRTQQAYQRFWEGATILQQVRGEWFNAVSSCFAFCTSKEDKASEVMKFQHLLIRLSSLLYCTALQQIAVLSDEAFEILDLDGLDKQSLDYLGQAPEKCLVILQWIQRLIVQNTETGVLNVPPPILSRVYQELSRGIVNIVNAQKITDIIFPFPYAQMVTVMLIVTSGVTPYLMAVLVQDSHWCALLSFASVFAYWCMNYIAAEIEMPFGEDANDLPIAHLQEGLNTALRMLLDEDSRNPPAFEFDPARHGACLPVKCPFELVTDVQHKIWGSCQHKLRRTLRVNDIKRTTRITRATQSMGVKSATAGGQSAGISSNFSKAYDGTQSGGFASSTPIQYKAPQRDITGSSSVAASKRLLFAVEQEPSNRKSASSLERDMPSSLDLEQAKDVSKSPGGDMVLKAQTQSNDSNSVPSMPLTQPAGEASSDQCKSRRPLLDSRLAGAITRMQGHFFRISEDVSFIARHPSWPRAQADAEVLSDTEVAKFSASIELHCASIAKALGGLAVALCARSAEGFQMPAGLLEAYLDSDNPLQPSSFALGKCLLPL